MNKKKTAVEWLEIQFDKYTSGGVNVPNDKIFKLTEKAKAKEKEQIMDAFSDGEHQQGFEGEAEQYYNENYES